MQSKGNIILSKVTNVVVSKSKKNYCFEIQTPERTYYVRASDEKKMKEWIDAVQVVSQIHRIRDKFQGQSYYLSAKSNHDLIQIGKKIINLVTRITGISKAIILSAAGKLKQSKMKNVNLFQINVDNDLLGNAAVNTVRHIMLCVDDTYNGLKRDVLNTTVDKLTWASENMKIHGKDTQNASALEANTQMLIDEANKIKMVPLPSPKTEILHFVKALSDSIQEYSEAANNEERSQRANYFSQCSSKFKVVAEEVYKLITDNTYAVPYYERIQLLPNLFKEVSTYIKTATLISSSQTYATNASKTLFFILNQVRELVIVYFPKDPRESEYPPVGPEDSQFKLQSEEEFKDVLKEQSQDDGNSYRPLPPIPTASNKALQSVQEERKAHSQPSSLIITRNLKDSGSSLKDDLLYESQSDVEVKQEENTPNQDILSEFDMLLASQENVIKSNPISITSNPQGHNTPIYSSSPVMKSSFTSSTPGSTGNDVIDEMDALLQNYGPNQ